jgi:hypothetical protein
MLHRALRRVSPSMAVALLALFVALGGVGYSATGGTFILGQANTATSQSTLSAATAGKTLVLTNTDPSATSKALALNVPSGHAPFEVNSSAKVGNLNADKLDGLDSTAFARLGVAQSAGAGSAAGVIDVTNIASGNGAVGRTADGGGSGVYGQNMSTGGYGVAGRANGLGAYGIYGDNTGGGFAGYFTGDTFIGGTLTCAAQCIDPATINGKVADADQLDGISSGGFVQGSGRAGGIAIAESPGDHFFLGGPLLGFLRLSYQCPTTLSNPGVLVVYNDSGSTANVFIESGSSNPTYTQMSAGASGNYLATATADSFHIQAQGAPGIETIEIATVNRSSDCHAQAQALLTN